MANNPRSDLVEFVETEYPRLSGVLALYCGDRDLGEELAQEALTRACRDWSRVARAASPSAWTTRVALNLANSFFRRRLMARRVMLRLANEPTLFHSSADTADAIAVRQAVAKLPRRQRTVLVLRYYLDLSLLETAEVMECPAGTVKTLTRKAIAALRQDFPIDEQGGITDVT